MRLECRKNNELYTLNRTNEYYRDHFVLLLNIGSWYFVLPWSQMDAHRFFHWCKCELLGRLAVAPYPARPALRSLAADYHFLLLASWCNHLRGSDPVHSFPRASLPPQNTSLLAIPAICGWLHSHHLLVLPWKMICTCFPLYFLGALSTKQ